MPPARKETVTEADMWRVWRPALEKSCETPNGTAGATPSKLHSQADRRVLRPCRRSSIVVWVVVVGRCLAQNNAPTIGILVPFVDDRVEHGRRQG